MTKIKEPEDFRFNMSFSDGIGNYEFTINPGKVCEKV